MAPKIKRPDAAALRTSGFTLVELLAAISIIGFLAGMTLLALRGAQQQSDIARTRGTIAKLHEVMAARWEEYLVAPIPCRLPDGLKARDPNTGQRLLSNRGLAQLRLKTLRLRMCLEMPDRPGEILAGEAPGIVQFLPAFTLPGFPAAVPIPYQYPADYRGMRERIRRVHPGGLEAWSNLSPQEINGTPFESNDVAALRSAELLYMIVEQSFVNGSSAIELFRSNEVGDFDGNGLPEFRDAWGSPIAYVRWPTGFTGAGANYLAMADPFFDTRPDLSRDPLDATGVDADFGVVPIESGPLFPLIVSAGPDGRFGMQFLLDAPANSYRAQLPGMPDPYFPRGGDARPGRSLVPAAAIDNLTNFDP